MKYLLLFLSLIPLFAAGQVPQLLNPLYNWDDTSIPSSVYNSYNEIWGVVANNREFAVMGSTVGTHFFDLTDINNAQELPAAFVAPSNSSTSVIHRDYHDYQCYLYAICQQGATLQIIDYSDLPNSTTVVHDDNTVLRSAHNLFIDTSRAVLYAIRANNLTISTKSLMVFSLADPVNPAYIASYNSIQGQSISGAHDLYVRDGIAYINSGGSGFVMADFNDPANPILLGSMTSYPQQGYNHSGWLSEDGNYYFLADENHNRDLKVVDVSDPTDIQVVALFDAGSNSGTSIPHNLLARGDFLYVSYYYDGIQVYDISDPTTPVRHAFYDTYPGPDGSSFRGAWGTFPFLPSGNIIVSDMQTGLYVFSPVDSTINGAFPPLGSSANCLSLPADLAPVLTVTPSSLQGVSSVNVVVKVGEVALQNTDGSKILVRVPVDPRFTFTWDPTLTTVGFDPVQNNHWTYSAGVVFHEFETSKVITAGTILTFGYVATYDPQNTSGQSTLTVSILPGSGSEQEFDNNSDAEQIIYFN